MPKEPVSKRAHFGRRSVALRKNASIVGIVQFLSRTAWFSLFGKHMPSHMRCRDACPSENVFEYPCHASKNARLRRVELVQPEMAGPRDKKWPDGVQTRRVFERLS